MKRWIKWIGIAVLPVALLGVTVSGYPLRARFQSVRIGNLNPLVALPVITSSCDLCFQNVVDSTGAPGTATQGFFSKNVSANANAVNFGLEVGNNITSHEITVGVTSSTRASAFWGSAGAPTTEQSFISSNAEPICIGIANSTAFCALGTTSVTTLNFGQTTDNPAYNFLGTGTLAVPTGNITVGGSSVCRADGTNCPGGLIIVKRKAATTSRASTVALADDADLVTGALVANKHYRVDVCLLFREATSGAGGFQFQLQPSGGGSAVEQVQGLEKVNAVTASRYIDSTGVPVTYATVSTGIAPPDRLCFSGVHTQNGSASGLNVQWAQNASNVNATDLLLGSYMIVQQLD